MHILLAPDSFKESLSAKQVAEALKKGFQEALPDATFDLLPIGDVYKRQSLPKGPFSSLYGHGLGRNRKQGFLETVPCSRSSPPSSLSLIHI